MNEAQEEMEKQQEAKETQKGSAVEQPEPQGLEEETIEIKSKRSRTSVGGKKGLLMHAPVVHHELPLPEGAPCTPVNQLYEGKPMPSGQRLEYEQPFVFLSIFTHSPEL